MTPPINYNPATLGCTFPGCRTQDTATVDGLHGRRCTAHPPVFDPAVAVAMHVDGWPATAAAYVRWSA